MYSIVILFVTFVFLFLFAIGGLLNLPLFPVPARIPLDFALGVDHLDNGCVVERDFCFAVLTVCVVCFLHVGQCLLVSFGSFILLSDSAICGQHVTIVTELASS